MTVHFLWEVQEKVMTSQKRRHQQILSACNIKSCIHLAEVNLLYKCILVTLSSLIFWLFVADDTDTHCALPTLTVCLYCGSDLTVFGQSLRQYRKTCNYLLNTRHCKTSQSLLNGGQDKERMNLCNNWLLSTVACQFRSNNDLFKDWRSLWS